MVLFGTSVVYIWLATLNITISWRTFIDTGKILLLRSWTRRASNSNLWRSENVLKRSSMVSSGVVFTDFFVVLEALTNQIWTIPRAIRRSDCTGSKDENFSSCDGICTCPTKQSSVSGKLLFLPPLSTPFSRSSQPKATASSTVEEWPCCISHCTKSDNQSQLNGTFLKLQADLHRIENQRWTEKKSLWSIPEPLKQHLILCSLYFLSLIVNPLSPFNNSATIP